jgi:phospholipase D1/2
MFEPVDYLASSHHQKMLVVDYPEDTGDSQCGIRAFLGGLDLTKGRFDYAGHPVGPAPGEGKGDQVTWTYAQSWKLQSLKMTVDEWYNNETKDNRKLPRQPWHDVHAKLEGPAAWDYLREFVGRWLKAAGQDSERKAIWKLYLSLLDQKTFIPLDKPLLDGGWTVQVCRSLSSTHWDAKIPKAEAEALKTNTHWSEAYAFNWRLKESTEQSILRAYRRSIDQAERFIYIENQYFIGSGKYWGYDKARNDIPERLVRKILERYKKKQPFHVYIVMPMFPEGDPGSGAMCTVRALEYGTIKWMIHGLTDVMGDRWREYLSFYFLANWKPVPRDKWVGWHSDNNDLLGYLMKLSDAEGRRYRLERHQRYMIYVHTKMMIVDDRYVLLGSCNLNDRGLMGDGDSEIAISAWPRLGSRETCTKNIQDLRKRLWTEHLAPGDLPGAWEHPESSGCVDRMRKRAFQNYKSFREMGPMTGHLCLWHWNYDAKQKDLVLMPSDKDLGVPKPIESPEPDMWLPDASVKTEDQAKADGWTWRGDVALWGAYRWLAK